MLSRSKTRSHLIGAVLLVVISYVAANAYTIVLYGGKKVEVPANFVVTSNAVVYEISKGFNASLQLSTIDIAATERANGEPSGAFRRHGVQQSQPQPSQQVSAARTITNKDLEPYERVRVASEEAFEKRRQELGLQTLDEYRQQREQDEAELDQMIARRKQQEAEDLARQRTELLQSEIDLIGERMNAAGSLNGQPWLGGFVFGNEVGLDMFGSRSRFGFRRGGIQGSPCGFNASVSCLLSHPFSFANQFPQQRRSIFVAPDARIGGRRGGAVFVAPRRMR